MKAPVTIWSKSALPLEAPHIKSLLRYVFPVNDVVTIVGFGIPSLVIGSRIVDPVVLPWFSISWALLTLIGASVALSGLITMHEKVEIVGRCAVGIGLLVYMVATVFHVFADSPSSILTFAVTSARIAPTVWQINRLVDIIGRKEAAYDE